ncbi:MAG: LamG domain-containing protein [Pirellulales bacterium]|nr:LamG domain-containing protein [Pirellulales bacterium]
MFVPLYEGPRRRRRTAARFRMFEYVNTGTADIGASQGIATIDGVTFWVAAGTPPLIDPDNSYLYKYTRNGNVYTLVASRATSGDWPTGMTQINSVHHHNGTLYIGGNNYSATPRKGWVLEYDPDDLTHQATHVVDDHWSEGGAWRTSLSQGSPVDEFWCCYANQTSTGPNVFEVSRYDATFAHIHNKTLPINYDAGSLLHEGLAWKGNLLFSMIHEGTTPLLAEIYRWDPVEESFTLLQRLRPPTDECTQGLALASDERTMWWAERFHGGSPTQDHRIVESTLHEVRVPRGRVRLRGTSAQATDLFAWYPLNDGAGSTAAEKVSGMYNGILAGGASWTNEPARGPSVAFDGLNGKVAIPAGLLDSTRADVTICGWFLADTIGKQTLISGNKVGANTGDWQLNMEVSGAIRFAYNSIGTSLATLDTATGAVRRGEWFHVTAVLKSGGDGYGKIYLNGKQSATNSTTGTLGGNGQEIRIGLQSNDNEDFKGKAHDVRFYDAALAPAIIAAMSAPETMFDLWR